MPVGHEWTRDVEPEGELQRFAEQLLLRYRLTAMGFHELPPGLVPEASTARATVNAAVGLLRDGHRPSMDIDAIGPEPVTELPCLGKQVVLDELAFEPRKGGKEPEAVAKVEHHPWPCIVPKARVSPTPMRTRTEGWAVSPSQFYAVLVLSAR